jgi:amidase
MSTVTNWKDLAADKKKRQTAEIPKGWLLPNPPPESQLDVSSVPVECGLLTPEELEITETKDVALLLRRLATGVWSSVAVTTAYYKRAIIAQQLVSSSAHCFRV